MKTICLDPGHGGADRGALGPDELCEKDCTLVLALLTGAALVERDFNIFFTRQFDQTLSFEERVSIANLGGADGFLSLHFGGSKNPRMNGAIVTAWRQGTESAKWAKYAAGAISKGLCPPLVSRGVHYGRYPVLGHLRMPSILVETAFITSQKESSLLLDEDFLKTTAKTLAEATQKYFTSS